MPTMMPDHPPTWIACGVGLPIGWAMYQWGCALTHDTGQPQRNSLRLLTMLVTSALLGGFTYCYFVLDCQKTPMIQPDPFWHIGRAIFHGVLIAWLVAATVTDFRDYVIPDAITVSGFLVGIALATAAGDLQMVHWWLDWNQEVPGQTPAWFPPWIAASPHWHGCVWSLTGAVAGAGLTQVLRVTAAVVLGQQALGFGDVMLMGMVGSFLGWQPVVCAFFLAPVCGIPVAAVAYLCSRKGFVPYGPFLATGTLVVLFSWRYLWINAGLRYTFGDVTSLLWIAAIAYSSLLVLLVVLRIYRNVPVQSTTDPE